MSRPISAHSGSASFSSTEEEVDIDEEQPVDTGLIRCICDSSEDDGFTIQCERCLVWQHAFCVKINQHNIPDHYLCDECEKKFPRLKKAIGSRKVQHHLALENSQQDMSERKRQHSHSEATQSKQKREDKLKGRPVRGPGDKQHFRDIHNRIQDARGDQDYQPTQRPSPPQQRKNPVGRPSSKKPKLSKRIAVSKKVLREFEPDEDLFSPSFAKPKSMQGHIEVKPLTTNVVRSCHVRQVFKEAREKCSKMPKWKGDSQRQGDTPNARGKDHYFAIMESSAVLPSTGKTSIRPLQTWNANAAQRSTKAYHSPPKGVFADTDTPANRLLSEIHGEVILKSEYKFNPSNDFVLLGTPCNHVFFYPTLDLCVDARYQGSDARHLRRSCHPNAELRSIVVPDSQEDQTVRLGVFTRCAVEKGDEITVGWNWQRGHISWKKNVEWHRRNASNMDHHVIDEEEKRDNCFAVNQMLIRFLEEFGDCACDDKDLCFIEYLKKEARNPLYSNVSPCMSPLTNKMDADGSGQLDSQARLTPPERGETRGMSRKRKASPTENPTEGKRPSTRPSSRQTIVSSATVRSDLTTKEDATMLSSSGDENTDIDVTSTSPVGGSPVIHQAKSMAWSASEEELDIDGDIDIGDDTTAAPVRDSQSHATQMSTTSLSSIPEDARNGPAESGHTRTIHNSHLSGSEASGDADIKKEQTGLPDQPAAKLPRKKIWMRNFIETHKVHADEPKPDVKPAMAPASPENGGDTLQADPLQDSSSQPIPAKVQSPVAPLVQDTAPSAVVSGIQEDVDMDDGELSDGSSASTIPIDDGHVAEGNAVDAAQSDNIPTLKQESESTHDIKEPSGEEGSLTEQNTTASTANGDHTDSGAEQPAESKVKSEALPNATSEGSKPGVVRYSLQEYLLRRAMNPDTRSDDEKLTVSGAKNKAEPEQETRFQVESCIAIDSTTEADRPEATVNGH